MKSNTEINLFTPVLTIGGSDNSGGAGIQADLKTFMALDCYGLSAVTALTAQNAAQFLRFEAVPAEMVYDQIKMSVQAMKPKALKTGMLATQENIRSVARSVRDFQLEHLVIDPVLKSSTGNALVDSRFIETLKAELIPLAFVVTPNAPEAEILTGIKIKSYGDVENACKKIYEIGSRNVIIKGGHLEFDPDYSVDTWYNGIEFTIFRSPKIQHGNYHGTGCAFSAALTACLAKKMNFNDAVQTAKNYVLDAMEGSNIPGYLCHNFNTVKPFS